MLSFDQGGLPTCCGSGLIPGEPYTECQLCRTRFDTERLASEMLRLRAGKLRPVNIESTETSKAKTEHMRLGSALTL